MRRLIQFLLLLLPLSVDAGMMNFTVSPAIVKFETVQGSTKAFDLSFFNQGREPLAVMVEVMDFTLDPHGVPALSSASREPHQWARSVELSQDQFRVNAGESEQIHVTLKTPRGKPGGGYFAVLFHATEVGKRKRGRGGLNTMRIGGQLPTLFIGEISRTGVRKGEVSSAQLNKGPYGNRHPMKFRYLLENRGTTHMNVSGDILIRTREGKVVDRIRLEGGSGLILPGGGRYFLGVWPKVTAYPGKRLFAEARFSYQGGRVAKKLAVTIP